MYPYPDPWLARDHMRRRQAAAERHHLIQHLEEQAARRRRERFAALRRDLGFWLVELGLRLAARSAPPAQGGPDALGDTAARRL